VRCALPPAGCARAVRKCFACSVTLAPQQRKFDPFDFAYGLTVHKAQGSQWSNVTIFDEAGVFGEHARRWLYTAITRAADRLTLVLSDTEKRKRADV
jgi:ATP-dependent exoDNAse (exonuclease V) alpha subunit